MTRIAIVGGALQGMEAVYLAKQAGYWTVVLDRKSSAPAITLADEHYIIDPTKDITGAKRILKKCDVVIPACEEIDLLRILVDICSEIDVPLLFDMNSYQISCSKLRSNEIMEQAGAPLPKHWPECGFPVIVKPSSQSGSIGVSVAFNDDDVKKGLEKIQELGDSPVIQEFVSGKSVSIEVIGNGSDFRSFVTTEVILDSNYDCKMVICNPNILSKEDDLIFADIGEKIAKAIGLRALTDVEAILTEKGLRVLEIDARIPSQTPAAIYMATGINLLEELTQSALGKGFTNKARRPNSSVYYHLHYKDGILRTCGEKEFGHVVKPHFENGLFGSDDAITDYEPGKNEWHATLISEGRNLKDVRKRFDASIEAVRNVCDVKEFIDRSPEVV